MFPWARTYRPLRAVERGTKNGADDGDAYDYVGAVWTLLGGGDKDICAPALGASCESWSHHIQFSIRANRCSLGRGRNRQK